MQKKRQPYILFAVAFVIAAGGFLLQFWPLEVVGILLLSLSGHWIYGVIIAFLLDIAYGVPVGPLHMLLLPFTILALLSAVLQHYGKRYFFDSSAQDTL